MLYSTHSGQQQQNGNGKNDLCNVASVAARAERIVMLRLAGLDDGRGADDDDDDDGDASPPPGRSSQRER